MVARELNESRETERRLDKKHTHRRRYSSDAPNGAAAMSDVIAAAPPIVLVDNKELRLVGIRTFESPNSSMRFATADWATKDSQQTKEVTQPTETNDYEESFSVGGGSQTVQEAQSQVKYPSTATDFGNAINVQDDGSVLGVDIITPMLTFTRVHYLPDSVVTPAYTKGLIDAVGHTNSDLFLTYGPGELLLLSASGSKRGEDDWAVTFEFLAGYNDTGMTVAGVSGISKKAHDYLWVGYEPGTDDTAKKMKPTGIGVYVATVYKTAAFGTTLKI